MDDAAGAAAGEALGDVAQLADVARPVVGFERCHRVGGTLGQGHAVFHREEPQEVIEQRRHVVLALAQRRDRDVDDVEAVVEVFAEFAGGDPLGQAAVGRRHHAHVRVDAVAFVADALDFAGFEEAEQQRLHAQRHLADFVHEDGAAVGRFEQAALVAVGVGEAAARVPEELRFEERVGHRRAVDREHRRVPAPAALVDEVGHHFLAHTARARDEHLGVGPRGVLDFLLYDLQRLAPADEGRALGLRRRGVAGGVDG